MRLTPKQKQAIRDAVDWRINQWIEDLKLLRPDKPPSKDDVQTWNANSPNSYSNLDKGAIMTATETNEHLHDREAERAVLGAMLLHTDVIPTVMHSLGNTPDAFYTTDHKLIYSAAVDIYDQHARADILLVADQLKKTDQLKRVGGTIYLYDLQARIVETENTAFHAEIVRDKWTRRKILAASQDLRELATNQELETSTVLERSQQRVLDITEASVQSKSESAADLIKPLLTVIEERAKNPRDTAGLPSGFTDFDIATNGLQPGNFIVIAGRPGTGKTSFVVNIARNIAFDQKRPTAIFSLEMTKPELMTRILSSESHIPYQDLQAGRVKDLQWKDITNAADRIVNDGHIIINDDRTLSLGGLKTQARHIKSRNKDLSLLIVDYVQLLHTDRDYQNREREVADISRELKSLAYELDIPIIGCSQLNRESEKSNKKPGLANLRDSGALEQDADIAAFLHAEEADKEPSASTQTRQLLLLKNRNGREGEFELKFYPESMTFANIGTPEAADYGL